MEVRGEGGIELPQCASDTACAQLVLLNGTLAVSRTLVRTRVRVGGAKCSKGKKRSVAAVVEVVTTRYVNGEKN